MIIAETLKITLEDLGYEVVDIYMSGVETLKKFRPGMADILIMDIHLADKTSGIDTAIEIKKISDIPVIFITNNKDEYLRKKAIYETNAVHYLVKPFTRKDISIAIDFALKAVKADEFNPVKTSIADQKQGAEIFLKNGLGFKKIRVADILFLKADGSYCEFVFKDRSQVFSENLSYFEEKLSFAKELVRVHRSYIINTDYIERIHENRVWITGIEIPISKAYKAEITEKFRFIQ